MGVGGDLGGGDFAAALGGLFFEEAVDGVHLFFFFLDFFSLVFRGRRGFGLVQGGARGGVGTFSSWLRFSLRFLRRRAISARRMACSSAVRCFLICGSIQGALAIRRFTIFQQPGFEDKQGLIYPWAIEGNPLP